MESVNKTEGPFLKNSSSIKIAKHYFQLFKGQKVKGYFGEIQIAEDDFEKMQFQLMNAKKQELENAEEYINEILMWAFFRYYGYL